MNIFNRFTSNVYKNWRVYKWVFMLFYTAAFPTFVLLFFFEEHKQVGSVLILTLNALIYIVWINRETRYSRITRKEERVEKLNRELEEMVHTVEPSIFMLLNSGLTEAQIENRTYVDQTKHWISAVRFIFFPMAERTSLDSGDDPASEQRFAGFIRKLAGALKTVWLLTGLMAAIGTYISLNLSGAAVQVSLWALVIWLIWTALWVAWALALWRRKHDYVTDQFLGVVIRRLPFEDNKSPRVRLEDISAVTLTVPLLGRVFGYGHLDVTAKGHDDPAVAKLLFVRDFNRVEYILNTFMDIARGRGDD